MFSKFLSLELEKQQYIINAAMKEFAEKGFKNASTNKIVKTANIGKGMLFHYFNSKKDLYLYIYDYTVKIFIKDLVEKTDLEEKDIFDRLRQRALLEIEIINKYPDMFNFIMSASVEEADDVKSDLELRTKKMMNNRLDRYFEDFDTSKFKEDIDLHQAVKVIIWTLEGISTEEYKKLKSLSLTQSYYEEILVKMDSYIKLLKKCFYK
ncbi:TetR/AcrR family transcriptional regulator [Clostridium sp. WILCCON 0269]|uniref:TetR/AcrR family transcriptional regulator n=1 Tax=Candidatus Clostridium eludens TaxID=3381663 RepID=A0ABW8SND1_9CLOT